MDRPKLAPPDDVFTKTLFEREHVTVLEYRKAAELQPAEWVDIGRGTLRVWEQQIKGYAPDVTQDKTGATKYSYTGFVRDIKLWMDLTQYAGAKPIFSHVVNEDTTRFTPYAVNNGVLMLAMSGDQGRTLLFRQARGLSAGAGDTGELEEAEHSDGEEDADSPTVGRRRSTLSEVKADDIHRAAAKDANDDPKSDSEDEEGSDTESDNEADLGVIDEGSKATELLIKRQEFAWALIDFLRARTRARAQISRSQLPRLFEQSGLVLYRRVGEEWKNYGPGTLEIFRVQGKPCMRFMQAHTGRCLLSTRLTTAAYSALPSRQNAVVISCSVESGSAMTERWVIAVRMQQLPRDVDYDIRASTTEDTVQSLSEGLSRIYTGSRSSLAKQIAHTLIGVLKRTPAKPLSQI